MWKEKGLDSFDTKVEAVVEKIIAETGASGIASMGKVMGLASAELAGKADGKTISTIVKKLLSQKINTICMR